MTDTTTPAPQDIAQRIAAAMARPEANIYDSIGEDNPYDPVKHTLIGEVPMHLRGLHNLLEELGEEVTAIKRRRMEVAKKAEGIMTEAAESIRGGSVPEVPEEVKQMIKELKDMRIEHNDADDRRDLVRSLFFNAIHAQFPELRNPELKFGSVELVAGWKVAAVERTEHEGGGILAAIAQALGGHGGASIEIIGLR